MLQKFKEHINKNFPFLKDKKLLIAISGGVDSVVLTHLFNSIKFAEISLAHCNFKLREVESDKDEDFINNLAKETNKPIFTISFETTIYAKENKISTQIAARELRYNWFQELVKKHHFNYVLTAHHSDDNLETFLINLTRGSGLDGFTGIPKKNGNIVRTLLPFSRDEILKYATKNNIVWREDASNASTKYVRNKIRHQVVPFLKEINPSLLETFAKSLDNLEESQQIIKDRIQDVSSTIIKKDSSSTLETTKFTISEINKLSNPKAYLYQLLKDYNFTEWNDIYNLLSAQSGKQVFSKTHRLLKDREFLILSGRDFSTALEKTFEIHRNQSAITNPIPLVLEDIVEKSEENKETIYIDKDLLKYPLLVRKWKNGDYLYPTGMQGKKKLSKYFKDEKFSLLEKENTWLLCTVDNEIIWVINHRQDRRFSPTKTTKNHLKITSI
ncbi:tRNA lysidine(34) synthetase TilS [Polaribacter reichenbachii]|uniref:tRNA(Ile)-lysidine synthase n=1 Tax=Polaribacter reichenbachii TaxID=996801 RepID=A0A1B8U6I0_9FLAO|nr:tRNA lysidine(34) synthetase TilS [Polaribacter reichenbachii]APZ46140.1 tRNA lysidine(34) synthetase TilS [Polaribacter reichenbachii]AUC20002.1 tRNA lysidine(34) synthetase TilS [Polaribacter reichenbachii]OBY67452.1 tRNA(Ile)-lysidine synthetase [Polaribacter reichenbachii]